MKSVLMVAFHYPPCAGTSGVHRTLSFSRYLPRHGWRPLVLSAHPRAYERRSDGQLGRIPDDAVVRRAFALDTGRHLSLRGRYLRSLALPDRWITWWLGAVPSGLRLLRAHRPAVIWSTYPLATTHLVALTLHRLTGTPWVADFRDPMTDVDYPPDPSVRRRYAWIERQVVCRAARLVFTTESARRMHLERHPSLDPARCLVIPNGYEEDDFRAISSAAAPPAAGPFRLLHSGVVYREERDPLPLLRALGRLKAEGIISPETLQVDFRDPGNEAEYRAIIQSLGLAAIVRLLPNTSHGPALLEGAAASALLLLQGPSCNAQIPAKTYEYLRLRKPILALTPEGSDTAAVLAECGGATRVDPGDEDAIHAALPAFVGAVRRGMHPLPDPIATVRYARHTHAEQLAACLTGLVDPSSGPAAAAPGRLRASGRPA
ncbi:MAG TPA: glycosyltransferase [Methylomirabilota bacterium]